MCYEKLGGLFAKPGFIFAAHCQAIGGAVA